MEIKKIKLPKGKAYIIDNLLSYSDIRFIYSSVLQGPYTFTQMSEPLSNIQNTRLAHHLEMEDNPVNDMLEKALRKILKKTKVKTELIASEIYVNIADAMTTTLPHTDRPAGCWTLLYYPNLEWDIKWGGQTNFIDSETMEIMAAVIPKPGRFILFQADILHQATPPTFFAPAKRLTIAMKLDPFESLTEEEMALSEKTIRKYEEKEYGTTNTCWN
jgi:hypothetical protein